MRFVETETGAAQTLAVPGELLASPIYANVRRAHAKLSDIAGRPPFALRYGKHSETAQTFGQL